MPSFQQNITAPVSVLGSFVQRASCTFGLNSAATTVELDLIAPNNPPSSADISYGASGWSGEAALPGKLVRFTFGAFDFAGIINAWTYSASTRGFVYNVKLTDPRILFNQYQVSVDGRGVPTGVFIPNFENVFNYYGSPKDADLSEMGITFAKFRDFLIATGTMYAWGNRMRFEFSSGFLDATGTNVSGVPLWYRIGNGIQTLGSVLDKLSSDLNLDYYAYIKTNTFNPTGINYIRIQDIPRRETGGLDEVSGFIAGARNSGVLLDYQYGQELRTDPNTTVLFGPSREYWPTINTSDVECVWGVTDKGTFVTTPLTASSGIVLLDHIINITGLPTFTSTVEVDEITFIKGTGNSYPPTVERVFFNRTLPGYRVSENILRAALFNKESWEAMLYYDNTPFAIEIGITGSPYLTPAQFGNLLANKFWMSNQLTPKNLTNFKVLRRDGFDQFAWSALQNEVFESTRRVAETYYGRQWLIRCGSSQWLAEGTYTTTDLKSYIEFEPTQYGWSNPNNTQSSGVLLNWPNLQGATSSTFKDEQGKTTAFLGVTNPLTQVDPTNFPHSVDLAVFNRVGFVLENSNKMAVPLQIEPYIKYPTKALAVLDTPIQSDTVRDENTFFGFRSQMYVSTDQRARYDFLRAANYTDNLITSGRLLEKKDDIGLAPRRLFFNVPISASQYGFFVPVRDNVNNFGLMYATGSNPGGVNLLQDDSYSPWMYGTHANMVTAGSGILGKSNNVSQYVDFGSFNVAGLPVFNIGEAFGANSIITSLSLQLSTEGFSTNYSLKSYNWQPVRLSQILQDRSPFVRLNNINSNKALFQLKEEAKKLRTAAEKKTEESSEVGGKAYLGARV